MAELVIADTSCLIVLSKIGRLSVLHSLYSTITITPEIKQEFGGDLPEWVTISSETEYQKLLRLDLDKGEASAISLGLRNSEKDPLIIIDEKKGRKVAQLLELNVIGTLGVLIKAKQQGMINSLANEIDALKKVDFRMSEDLIQGILEKYDVEGRP